MTGHFDSPLFQLAFSFYFVFYSRNGFICISGVACIGVVMFHGWGITKTEQITTVIKINWWIDGLLGLALNACSGLKLQNEIRFCCLLHGMTIRLHVMTDIFWIALSND